MKICENGECKNEAKWGIVFEEDANQQSMIVCDECKCELQLLYANTKDKNILAVFELH